MLKGEFVVIVWSSLEAEAERSMGVEEALGECSWGPPLVKSKRRKRVKQREKLGCNVDPVVSLPRGRFWSGDGPSELS